MSKQSTFLNMVLTLLVIALISSASVGAIYEITKGPIAEARLARKISAIREVLPEFDNNPLDEQKTVQTQAGDINIYPAKKAGQDVGVAVESVTNQGFGGAIRLMVGFLPDGTINDVAVLEHKETPGLGDKMEKGKSNFSQQFQGKNPQNFQLKVKKDGGDVDAITAATITSRGFVDAVERAYTTYKSETRNPKSEGN